MNQKAASTNTGIESRPARWQRLKSVLADALEQKSLEARRAVLIQSCDGDTALLHAAEKLLASDTAAFEEFAEFAATRLTQNGRNRIGERIGAYAIVKELGRGGMGTVYLAERADGQFERRVAIKVLKRGTDNDVVLRRLRLERRRDPRRPEVSGGFSQRRESNVCVDADGRRLRPHESDHPGVRHVRRVARRIGAPRGWRTHRRDSAG